MIVGTVEMFLLKQKILFQKLFTNKLKYIFSTQIHLSIPEIFKTNVKNRFLCTKSCFEIVFWCCEFTKVIF